MGHTILPSLAREYRRVTRCGDVPVQSTRVGGWMTVFGKREAGNQ